MSLSIGSGQHRANRPSVSMSASASPSTASARLRTKAAATGKHKNSDMFDVADEDGFANDGFGGGGEDGPRAAAAASPGTESRRVGAGGVAKKKGSVLAPPGASSMLDDGTGSKRSHHSHGHSHLSSPAAAAAASGLGSERATSKFAEALGSRRVSKMIGQSPQRPGGGVADGSVASPAFDDAVVPKAWGGIKGARKDDSPEFDAAYHDMVENNPLHWCDPVFAKHNTEEAWFHYTRKQVPSGLDGAKYMLEFSLTELASDIVDRMCERYRIEIKRTNPKFTAAQVEATLMKELPLTNISDGAKHLPAMKAYVVTALKKSMDKTKDGKGIRRAEFIQNWQLTVKKLMYIPDGRKQSLCTIL